MRPLLPVLLILLSSQKKVDAFSGICSSRTRVCVPSPSNHVQFPARAAPTHAHTYSTKKLCQNTVGQLMLSSADNEETVASDGDKKLEGRKNRVIVGYKAMVISYLTTGLLAVVRGGVSTRLLRTIGSYIIMPAGISYIMISAAKHDRLGSDTYKRLNLALLEYGVIGLSVIAISNQPNPALALSLLLSVINSTKGYAYGVLGWDKQNSETTLLKDFTNGILASVKGFFSVPKNIKSFGYLGATTMITVLKLLKLSEIVKLIQANSNPSVGLATLLAQLNRLAFFQIMLYTLKDAADRDRLGGTTFIQLNYLCALAMGAQCAFFTGGVATPPGALSAFFAAFCAFNGITSYMKNQYA